MALGFDRRGNLTLSSAGYESLINRDENGKLKFGKIPRDKDFLLDNHYFHGLLEIAMSQRAFYSGNFQYTPDETDKVLQLIKDELGEEEIKN